MRKIKLNIILVLTLLSIFGINTSLGQKAEREMMPLPEFKYCSCGSATFCLDDEDVIKLHAWYENMKWANEPVVAVGH